MNESFTFGVFFLNESSLQFFSLLTLLSDLKDHI